MVNVATASELSDACDAAEGLLTVSLVQEITDSSISVAIPVLIVVFIVSVCEVCDIKTDLFNKEKQCGCVEARSSRYLPKCLQQLWKNVHPFYYAGGFRLSLVGILTVFFLYPLRSCFFINTHFKFPQPGVEQYLAPTRTRRNNTGRLYLPKKTWCFVAYRSRLKPQHK